MAQTKSEIGRKNPIQIPVLAVRDQVQFPGVVMTLLVARSQSREALHAAQSGKRLLFVVTQSDSSVNEPTPSDLCEIGTVSELLHSVPLPDGSARVVMRGLYRASSVITDKGHFVATINELPSTTVVSERTTALQRLVFDIFSQLAGRHKQIPPEALESVVHVTQANEFADAVAHYTPLSIDQKQSLLEDLDCESRLESIYRALKAESSLMSLEQDIRNSVESELGNSHREYFLREQIRTIQNELGIKSSTEQECAEYREKAMQRGLSGSTFNSIEGEIRRLEMSGTSGEGISNADALVIRNYLDTVLNLPWNVSTEDNLDIVGAESSLDEHHYGLHAVKERILEFLAVRKLNGTAKGTVLCFIGPPGVGKTSLAQTVATALNRKCVSIALGGVRDEAEIRGHRRTYVGARPGRIIQAIRESGANNPILVLDEIDKIIQGVAGDPTSALLEVLDSEQNNRFVDHFLEVPFDLSEVLFVTTANLVEGIPVALRDRMELIEFPGYSEFERINIGRQHIEPMIGAESGLGLRMPPITDAAIKSLATEYTRESGVRSLRREFARLGRKLAKMEAMGRKMPKQIDRKELIELLGLPPAINESRGEVAEIGMTHGLVVTTYGGDIMQIEVSLTKPIGNEPKLTLTGALGVVMQESVQTSLACIRRILDTKGVDSRFDVHVHLPQAAIPKDGPSAGVPISVALYSAFTSKPVHADIAMSGEVTLHGNILPVGGLREKILAAKRFGFTKVLYPKCQLTEVTALDAEIQAEIILIPIAHISEGLEIALPSDQAQTVNMR
jgi:ATP-dependent Lon protease